jgi:superfamily II RNA helicase
MLPEYESRVEVLKRLQFIDDNATVLLKGRVACEINSAPELILTDLILENILADFTPREAVALLSIFVFVEKTDSQPQIPDKLADGLEHIYRIADDVEREQDRCSVGYDEFKEKFKPGLVEVVYEWAGGMVSRPRMTLVWVVWGIADVAAVPADHGVDGCTGGNNRAGHHEAGRDVQGGPRCRAGHW